MRVAIDLTALLPQRTGVDTYMLGMVRALAEIDRETHYSLYVNRADAPALRGLPRNFSVRRASLRPRLIRLAFQQLLLPLAAATRGVDVVHSPAFISPLVRGRQRHLLTIHDLTSFSIPEAHTRLHRSSAYRALVARSIRAADRVSVPSAWVASELRERFPEIGGRVRVDPPGIGSHFRPQSETEVAPVLARLGIEAPYLLFVGTLQPRKNVLGLLAAYRLLVERRPDTPRLALVGASGWGDGALRSVISDPLLQDRIVLPGYVSASDLPALYGGATIFLFPSLAEGFGFPPLEAMASGTPVVASDSSSLTENLAGAAELVPATDAGALAATIERLLADRGARETLAARGLERARRFSWAELGRRMAANYAELAEMRVRRPGGLTASSS
jgi:glycosyltransferase involved in cell wall biosynthesis